MQTLRYVVCDVFTDRALTGNALAVFTNPGPLSDVAMQALAREMNLSETVFVQRPQQGGHARMRIFTPTREVPFAGHPTLGTAVVLGQPMQLTEIRLETGVGIVPVVLEREGARVVFGWMRQPIPHVAPAQDTEALLQALGVARSASPIECYDNGLRHVFVEVDDKAAVAKLTPDFGALARAFDGGVNVIAGAGAAWKSRMFAPSHGVNEDPATGSAAGPLALHVSRHGRVAFGTDIVIEQGAELQRPSTLYARVRGTVAQVESVEVGGGVVVVANGEFRLHGAWA